MCLHGPEPGGTTAVMGTATLEIDLSALVANWQALDALSDARCATGAVVKANGYGLGADQVGRALYRAGVRQFFVAQTEEGAQLRNELGREPDIFVLSGHMPGDTEMIGSQDLTPCINSIEQMTRHFEALPGHSFAVQLDTGMNRLGLKPGEWAAVRDIALAQQPDLVMSHLACSDTPDDPMNRAQLDLFRAMTEGLDVPLSLSATGGILLGKDYHFDLTRPGIGLYGGAPFADARPVARLALPVIQIHDLEPGEPVGYGCTWEAPRPSRIATVAGGYADGLSRLLSNRATLYHGRIPCPAVGRVSMDMITVDITHLEDLPAVLDVLSDVQTVDDLAESADTIGYEVLTQLGPRYARRYLG